MSIKTLESIKIVHPSVYGILTAIEDIWQSGMGGKLIFDSLWSVMDTSLHQPRRFLWGSK